MENHGPFNTSSKSYKARPKQRMEGDEGMVPRIRSRDLFGSGRRVIIDHEGREYFLLITRQGKLILNRSS